MSLKLDKALELVHLNGDTAHFRSPDDKDYTTVTVSVGEWKVMGKPVVITALLEKL